MGLQRKIYNGHIIKKRTYAFTLDLFLIILLNKVLINSYALYLQTVFYHFPPKKQLMMIASLEQVFLGVFALLFFSYFTFSFYLGNGQTPGKMLFAVKVVNAKNDGPAAFWQSAVRTIFQAASCILFFLPFASLFIGQTGRGLHDWASGTKIIRVPKRETLSIEQIEDDDIDYLQAA